MSTYNEHLRFLVPVLLSNARIYLGSPQSNFRMAFWGLHCLALVAIWACMLWLHVCNSWREISWCPNPSSTSPFTIPSIFNNNLRHNFYHFFYCVCKCKSECKYTESLVTEITFLLLLYHLRCYNQILRTQNIPTKKIAPLKYKQSSSANLATMLNKAETLH